MPFCHNVLRDRNSVGKPKQRAIQTCLGNLGDFSCGTYVEEVKRKVENFCFLKNELLIPIFDLFVRYPLRTTSEELHCKSDHEVL